MTTTTRNAPIEGVVFDMDGLLLDSETLAMEAMVAVGDKHGYDMPMAFCRQMIGIPADQCRRLVHERFDGNAPVADLFAAQDAMIRTMVDTGGLALKAGVHDMLDLLDAEKMPRAIATSSSRARVDHHLEVAGLLSRFDAIVTRDDVTHGKPNPEPYVKAMAAIGIAPSHCLALEDSPTGARAAQAAHIRTIVIPDLIAPPDDVRQAALFVATDMHEAIAYLREIREATRHG